ncbi:MAG: hypothetical protein ACRDEB_05925 [Chitinophagaceae bacterium]
MKRKQKFIDMKMNAGMWIGIIGGIIGLIAGIGAVVTTGGKYGIWMGLGMLVIFGGMFYLFYRIFFKPMINAARLQKKGLPGKATILEVKDTGITINNNPQVKLLLEVKNNYGQKYNAQCRVMVSRLNPGMFMPGMEVAVKIDPDNEQNVVIDFSGSEHTSSNSRLSQTDEPALKYELELMQKENEAISISGKTSRAIIKKYTWLGAYVNGNNPYVELEVEVLPEHASSFSGKAKGVIAETSVPKYQPGREIFVKYDLYDNSKVVIDHS